MAVSFEIQSRSLFENNKKKIVQTAWKKIEF